MDVLVGGHLARGRLVEAGDRRRTVAGSSDRDWSIAPSTGGAIETDCPVDAFVYEST
jgi:hypothetical protein